MKEASPSPNGPVHFSSHARVVSREGDTVAQSIDATPVGQRPGCVPKAR
jgi:hypothetical protein